MGSRRYQWDILSSLEFINSFQNAISYFCGFDNGILEGCSRRKTAIITQILSLGLNIKKQERSGCSFSCTVGSGLFLMHFQCGVIPQVDWKILFEIRMYIVESIHFSFGEKFIYFAISFLV